MFKFTRQSKSIQYCITVALMVALASGGMLLPAPGREPAAVQPIAFSDIRPTVEELMERKKREALAAQERLDKILAEHKEKQTSIELIAPYWREGGGFNSTIVINNTFIRTVSIVPVIFMATGQALNCAPITLEAHASANLQLKDLIGKIEGYGQMALRYTGEPLEINAVAVIEDPKKSLVFDHPFEIASDSSSTNLEGIFYLPSPSAKAEIAFSNSGETPINVDLSFSEEGASSTRSNSAGRSDHIKIAPHHTEVLNSQSYLLKTNSPKAVRAALTSSGAPGQLLIQGFVADTNGFSANMRFLESSTLTGGKLFSPLLPISGPLNPIVLLSNPGASDTSVEIEAYYKLGGESEDQTLFNTNLVMGATQHVDLGQSIKSLVTQGATDIGLTISYGPRERGLMADVLLIDQSGSGVYQVSPKGYNSVHFHYDHAFPFRISDAEDTIITIANPNETDEVVYSLHLFYEGKTYTYRGTSLRPGEVRYVDIKKLRDQRESGQLKETIPLSITSGEATLHFGRPKSDDETGHKGHMATYTESADIPFASATIFDSTSKMSFSTCSSCQPGEFYDMLLSDDVGDSGGYDWLYMEDGGIGENRNMYVEIFDTNGEYNLAPRYFYGDASTGIAVYGDASEGGTAIVNMTAAGSGVVTATIDLFDIYGLDSPTIAVYADVYSVAISQVNVADDDPDNYNIDVVTDGPNGTTGTLTVYLKNENEDSYVVYSQADVGLGSHNVPLSVMGLAAGTYQSAWAYYRFMQATTVPTAQILGCSVGADLNRLVNEYRNKNHHPICADFSYQPSTANFNWPQIQSHGHSHPDFGLFNIKLGEVLDVIKGVAYNIQINLPTPGVPGSGNRVFSCPIHNGTISGADPNSQHIYGDAADIHSGSHQEWLDIRSSISGLGTINGSYGTYQHFCSEPNGISGDGHVHLDMRGNGALSGDSCPNSSWILP